MQLSWKYLFTLTFAWFLGFRLVPLSICRAVLVDLLYNVFYNKSATNRRSGDWALLQRIQHKLCTMMHSAHDRMCPVYLADTVSAIADNPTRLGLRSADSALYRLPRCRTSMGERAFSFSGPLVWNALPSALYTHASENYAKHTSSFQHLSLLRDAGFCNACMDVYIRQAIELRVLLSHVALVRGVAAYKHETFPMDNLSVGRCVGLSSALWENGGSHPDAVWHRRSDGSRDEARSGVWGLVHGKGYWGWIWARHCNQWRLTIAATQPSCQITLGTVVLLLLYWRKTMLVEWRSYITSLDAMVVSCYTVLPCLVQVHL